ALDVRLDQRAHGFAITHRACEIEKTERIEHQLYRLVSAELALEIPQQPAEHNDRAEAVIDLESPLVARADCAVVVDGVGILGHTLESALILGEPGFLVENKRKVIGPGFDDPV